MFELSTEWFMDYTSWAITLVMYLMFMFFIWFSPFMDSAQWEPYKMYRVIITILAPPIMYVVAKMMLERGR